jgi:alpha-glucosidase
MKKLLLSFGLLFALRMLPALAQETFTLISPQGKLKVEITVDETIQYSVIHQGDLMLAPSPVAMTLTDGKSFGIGSKLAGSTSRSVNQTIDAPFYKRKQINDCFNELTLKFKDGFNLLFRAYDEGIAYRFVSQLKQDYVVKSETAIFNFPANQKVYVPYVVEKESFEQQYFNSFENLYQTVFLSEWDNRRLAFLPLLVEGVKGKKICITEADLLNYPGMYLYNAKASNSLTGVFAAYPKKIRQGGHNQLQDIVQSREDFIAKANGSTVFPWRVLIVSGNDRELADNDMVYKLASPSPQGLDFSWVKPGKVAWDWWNDWNLYQVDFKTGINNETYQHYIDFASQYGIEYVILDEGWAVNLQADLMQVVPEIDLKKLVLYASERKVSLILWAGYHAFNRDLEGVCKHYSEMGIKGFKVDFMDRDDQPMVDFHRRAASIAAKYRLMLDFHGTYKPTGLQRSYPNVVNFEGVHGLEQMKWASSATDQVTYDVTIPFIRMIAGPMDYTQGAMRNATKGNFRAVYNEAMSQGTRCRQLAEYVIFESPLSMLCDSPSNYRKESECMEFIAYVPTVWDNTISLDGKVGEYIVLARQKGEDWYVGALTNWDARALELNLSFLGEGNFVAEVFKDGINAGKAARDYKKETVSIPVNRKLNISMASGGGFVMKIRKQ